MRLLFFSLFFCSLELVSQSIETVYPLIEDNIDLLAGKYSAQKQDLVVQAAIPIHLLRANHQFRLYKKILRIYPHLYLDTKQYGKNSITVRTQWGYEIVLSKNSDFNFYSLDRGVFPEGISSMDCSVNRGANALEFIKARNENETIVVDFPNGDQRVYIPVKKKNLYLLREQKLFSGGSIMYHYDNRYRITQISTWSNDKSKRYAWAMFTYLNMNTFVIKTSDGQRLKYDFSPQRGTSRKVFNLVQVDTTRKPTEKLSYQRRKNHEYDDLTSIQVGSRNKWMFDYQNKSHKICKTYCKGQGSEALQEVKYQKQSCSITRGKTEKNTYYFDSSYRLKRIEKKGVSSRRYQLKKASSTQEIQWGALNHPSWINKRSFYDQGQLYITKEYAYDTRGNIVSITEKGEGEEPYTTLYSYIEGKGNLLRKVMFPDGQTEEYAYLLNTNLITSVMKKDSEGVIYKRSFYEYNNRNIRTKVIEDNGTSDVKEDLSGVTQRTLTITKLNNQDLPEEVVECIGDANTEHYKKTTKYTYNRFNEIQDEKVYAGSHLFYSIRRFFDQRGWCICLNHSQKGMTEFAYDENGHLINKKHNGLNYVYENNSLGKCVRCTVTDEKGVSKTDYSKYTPLGQKYVYKDFFGDVHIYRLQGDFVSRELINRTFREDKYFNGRGLLIKKIAPLLGETQYHFTSWGDLKKVDYSDGTCERYLYDWARRLIRFQDRNGYYTSYIYNNRGEVIEKKTSDFSEKYAYENGLLVSIKSPRKKEKRSYNLDGTLSSCKLCENGTTITTSYQYNQFGQTIETYEHEKDKLIQYTYNAKDQVKEKKIIQEEVVTFWKVYVYTPLAQISKIIDRCTNTHEEFYYDIFDRLIKKKTAEGVTLIEYTHKKNDGQIVTSKKTTYPHGLQKNEMFDGFKGLISKQLIDRGKTIWEEKNTFYSSGLVEKTSYYHEGNLLLSLHRSYDKNGYLSKLVEDFGDSTVTTHFKYDIEGNLLFKKQEGAEALLKKYDQWGRLIRVYGEKESVDYHYTYHKNGLLSSIEDKAGDKSTTWKYSNRETSCEEQLANGIIIKKTTDQSGRLLTLSLPHRATFTYKYLPKGKTALSRHDSDGKTLYVQNHQFLPQKDSLFDGAIYYERTKNGDLSLSSSNYFHQKTLERDQLGNITSYILDGNVKKCQYCSFAQRIKDGEHHIKATPFHKITHIGSDALKYDSQFKCKQYLNAQYAFDNKGRRTASNDKKYEYDCLDRLIAVKDNKTKWRYFYDGLDRRISKVKFLKENGFWRYEKKIDFLYDGLHEIGSTSNDQVIFRPPVYAMDSKKKFLGVEINDKPYAQQNDLFGNTAVLIDLDGDNVVERHHYSLLGYKKTTGLQGKEEPISPYLFQQKRYDQESGLFYFNKRYYDPQIGQFITKDPLSYREGPHMYMHARNLTGVYSDDWGYAAQKKDYFYDAFDSPVSFITAPFNYRFRKAIDNMSDPTLLSLGERDPYSTSAYFYVNGINTTLNEVNEVGNFLASQVKHRVNCFYVPSHGVLFDLIRSYQERKGFKSDNILQFNTILKDSLKAHKRVGVFAHSGGSSIVYEAMKMLSNKERERMFVYTFGTPIAIPRNFAGKVANFMSDDDVIFHIMKGKKSDVNFLQKHPLEQGSLEHSIAGRTYRTAMRDLAKKPF